MPMADPSVRRGHKLKFPRIGPALRRGARIEPAFARR